jgi:apolipoprotein N-acyltransferase
VLLGVAFLPGPFGALAWVGFVPLLVALDRHVARSRAGGFRLGYLFGLAFYLIGTHWIALLSDVAITVAWIKYPAWLLAGAYLAIFPGLACALLVRLARRGIPIAWAFPFVFLVIEELRGSGELGFPWFQPGYTQYAFAPVIQLASLGSVSLVTLWVLALNALLWTAWRARGRTLATLAAVVALALPWAWGQRVLDAARRPAGPAVALIQGNIPGAMKWSGRHQQEILDAYLALTARAAADTARPVIAIWPETATGTYLKKDVGQRLQVLAVAERTGVPVLAGFPDYAYDARDSLEYFNAAGTIGAGDADRLRYAKRHLVPFGERMPFQWILPMLGDVDFGQAEWTPGRDPVLFPSAAGPFTVLVCFESIFPDLARRDVARGARWLVNITNDEWFGDGAALQQHAAMARFRAVENHVPLARCANTGLTQLIDANGRVTAQIPVFAPGVIVGRLDTPGLPTWFTRIGDWPGAVALAWVVIACVRAWRRRAE